MIALKKKEHDFILKTLRSYCPSAEYWAFGSRVKGTHKEFSDLDLAIVASGPVDLDIMFQIKQDFADSALPFKVDVIDFLKISDEFKDHIKKCYVCLAEVEDGFLA